MKRNIFIILILVILVIISQYYLLSDSLTLGFKPDDWILYFAYKTLGDNPLSKLAYVWGERGLYTTYQVYYMGLLDSLFGLNYYSFHLSNLILKIIAILGLYPLVWMIFRNKLLSVLTVLLFALSQSSVGPLEFVVKGSDYLAIVFMEAFLLIYYLIIDRKFWELKYSLLLAVLLIFSFSASPIRMFPLLLIPLLIEIFLVFKKWKRSFIKNSLIRGSMLYVPFIVPFFFTTPISLTGNAYSPIGIIQKFLEGNWFLILAPFSGMGYSFITNEYFPKIFGLIRVEDLRNYAIFLLGGPTLFTGMITALISWSLITRNRILFFIITTSLNFIIQILFFFLATNHLRLTLDVYYDPTNLYSVILGGFVLILGIISFVFWLLQEDRKDKLMASLWIGSIFLSIFTFLTWAFAPLGTGFNSTSYYLVVASIGTSLVSASFLVAIYEKLKKSIKILAFIPFLILIPIFLMSSHEVRSMFSDLNQHGRGAEGQILMQQEARRVSKDFIEGDHALFYFVTSGIEHGQGPFYSEGFLTSFPFFMLLSDQKLIEGCIGVMYENTLDKLNKVVHSEKEIKGFKYPGFCWEQGKYITKELFFTRQNFYAFKIENKKLIDVKKEVLDQLDTGYSK